MCLLSGQTRGREWLLEGTGKGDKGAQENMEESCDEIAPGQKASFFFLGGVQIKLHILFTHSFIHYSLNID